MSGEISVLELQHRQQNGDQPFLLDVRNPNEWELCRLESATLIPLPELSQRIADLEQAVGPDRSREIVVYCRSGGRSQQAQQFLRQQGFSNVWNLTGGILAWSDQVDPTIPKY